MPNRPPPVPPENRPKHSATAGSAPKDTSSHENAVRDNPDKRGHTANTKQNTTHQGHQQDR